MAYKIYKAGSFLIIEDTKNDSVTELNSSNIQIKKEKTNINEYSIINANGQSILKVNLEYIYDANENPYTENDWDVFRFEQVGAQNTTDVSAVKPKTYKASLTQSGTSAPTAVVLENTLGDIVWTRNDTGYYFGTLLGAFTSGKTLLLIGQNYGNDKKEITYINLDSEDSIYIETVDNGVNSDSVLVNSVSILIEVYP